MDHRLGCLLNGPVSPGAVPCSRSSSPAFLWYFSLTFCCPFFFPFFRYHHSVVLMIDRYKYTCDLVSALYTAAGVFCARAGRLGWGA